MENPDIREFQSDELHVLMKEKPGCVVRLEVTTTPKAVAAAYESAHKKVKKEVSIPGFRKGKAPDEVIRNNFRDIVDREARTILRAIAFKEATTLSGRSPFNDQAVRKADLKRASMEEGAQLIFEYESAPVVPNIETAHLTVKRVEPKPLDQIFVEKAFHRLLENHATYTPITDRAASEGDFVKIDVDVIDSPARNLVSDRRVPLRKGECSDWLFDALLGMRTDESKDIDAPEEKGDGVKEMRRCRVFVKEITQCSLPTETPELLKELNAESFVALKERIKARLELDEQEAANEDMRRQLRNELIRHYAFDLPQSLVQAETTARLAQLKPKNEPALPYEKDKTDEMRKEVLEEVKRYFTCMFLLQKLAQKHNFEVSEKEFFDEMTHQLFYTPAEKRVIFADQIDASRQRIYMNIIMRKVEDMLIGAITGAKEDHGDHTSCSCPHH